MKKLLTGFLSACLVLTLIGCSQPSDKVPASTSPSATQQDPVRSEPVDDLQEPQLTRSMHALALPVTTEEVFSKDGTLLFSLTHQNPQVTLEDPALSNEITKDFQSRIQQNYSDAQTIAKEAETDFPETELWANYFLNVTYTPTRLDQNILSLFGNQVAFRGGAHPYVITESVTYDLQSGQTLTLDDILCDGYDRETLLSMVLRALEDKADELSYDYQDILTARFTDTETVIEDWYFSKTGLCFHFAPYDIAPYSAGTVIAEIAYDDLAQLLRPQYTSTVVDDATGSIYVDSLAAAPEQRFPLIASLNLASGSNGGILYSDATVTDLRIETGTLLEDGSTFIASGVVFAADTLGIGEAVRLTADFANSDMQLRLVYHSSGHEISSLINYDPVANSLFLTSN